MRFAQVSTVWESVPPQGYGGVERIVSYLAEELVRLDHEVTLFASADSKTRARLVSVCNHAVRTSNDYVDPTPLHVASVERAYQHADATRPHPRREGWPKETS